MPRYASNPLDRLYRAMPSYIRRSAHEIHSLEFRVVETVDELKAATRIVYHEYLKRGYANPQLSELRLSIFHALPETTTFVAIHHVYGIIGTVTVIQDSPLGLPMDDICHQELEALRKRGQRLAEVSMLAFHASSHDHHGLPRFHGCQMLRTLRLFKTTFDYLRAYTSVTELITCFHPRHQLLYDFLHMEPLAGVRPYAAVNGYPAMARHLNITHTQHLASAYPISQFFYGRPLSPRRTAHSLALSLDNLHDLFVRSSSIFATASLTAMTYIQSCYPTYQLSALLAGSGHTCVS